MPPSHYEYHSHHQRDEEQQVDYSPSYLSPSRSEPYYAQGFDAARQATNVFGQDGSSVSFMPQSNQAVFQETSNQFLAPPPPFGPQHRYDDGPYFNSSAFVVQTALQLPATSQVIVSGPPSQYEGHDMSPSIATGNITGTVGSETALHHGSGYYSNNSLNPRTHYGTHLHANNAQISNATHTGQQHRPSALGFGLSQPQQQQPLPPPSNSSNSARFECTCKAGFHKNGSLRK